MTIKYMKEQNIDYSYKPIYPVSSRIILMSENDKRREKKELSINS